MTSYTLETIIPHLPLAENIKLSSPFINFNNLIKPDSTLESTIIDQPEFKVGLNWGVPRFGHPEGKVGFHVCEVLDNIEKLNIEGDKRQRLRITAIAHDTFKFQESASIAIGKRTNHGVFARRFMERHISDDATLDLIELHDEIYYAWRHEALHKSPNKATERLDKLFARIGEHLLLHYLFFRCDTLTGDKIQAPRIWFDQRLKDIYGKDFSDPINWVDNQL